MPMTMTIPLPPGLPPPAHLLPLAPLALKPPPASGLPRSVVGPQRQAQAPQGTHSPSDDRGLTSVMLRNIPSRSPTEEVIAAIEEVGFGKDFTFFYMPQRDAPKHRILNKGYAFVAFDHPDTCRRFSRAISGYKFPARASNKTIEVAPARLQGNMGIMEHFADLTLNSRKTPIVVKSCDGQQQHRYAL